jgi:hypothetical protein
MQELIEKIISRTGISHEQATGALDTIKTFISEKFPVLATSLDGMLGGNKPATDNAGQQQTAGEEGLLEKVTHFAEEHAGDLKGNAGSLIEEAEEKLKGFFK